MAKNGGKKRKWVPPEKQTTIILPGWAGIFVSCPRGREVQCGREMEDWLEIVGEELWPSEPDDPEESAAHQNIEDQIRFELSKAKSSRPKRFVVYPKIGCDSLIFVQTKPPTESVKLVLAMCERAHRGIATCRYIQKLTPVSQFVHLDAEFSKISNLRIDLASLDQGPMTFAIRPQLRHVAEGVTRDKVIDAVAGLVKSSTATVDLQNYRHLIFVEGFRSVLGIAVVSIGVEAEKRLCRFNLTQICAASSGS